MSLAVNVHYASFPNFYMFFLLYNYKPKLRHTLYRLLRSIRVSKWNCQEGSQRANIWLPGFFLNVSPQTTQLFYFFSFSRNCSLSTRWGNALCVKTKKNIYKWYFTLLSEVFKMGTRTMQAAISDTVGRIIRGDTVHDLQCSCFHFPPPDTLIQ